VRERVRSTLTARPYAFVMHRRWDFPRRRRALARLQVNAPHARGVMAQPAAIQWQRGAPAHPTGRIS